MTSERSSPVLGVDGPELNERTQEHRYTVRSTERDIEICVQPEELNGVHGWCVRIEGIPAPSIVHDHPWPTVEAARDAGVSAAEDILILERMQREDRERGMPKDQDDEDDVY